MSKWVPQKVLAASVAASAALFLVAAAEKPRRTNASPSRDAGIASASSDAGQRVWVAKPTQSGSCGEPEGIALSEHEAELTRAKISVHDRRRGHDGNVYCKACGCPTGELNAFEVDESSAPKTRALGFERLPAQSP